MPINKNVFIKNYLSALNNGDAAIFAGAGLSAPSGCVNWKQLLREIAEELELDIEKESDLVAIAQYYYNKNGCNRTKLNDTIKFKIYNKTYIYVVYYLYLLVATYMTNNFMLSFCNLLLSGLMFCIINKEFIGKFFIKFKIINVKL